MAQILYVYIDVLSVIILAFILYRLARSGYFTANERSFSRVVANVIVVLALDAIAELASGTCYQVSIIANPTFLIWTGVVGYLWLCYAKESVTNDEFSRRARVLLAVPLLVNVILCYSSIWTGWIFWIDPSTILYHRGALYPLQAVLSTFYLVFSAVFIIKSLIQEPSPRKRQETSTLLAFLLLPAIGCLLGYLFYGVPFMWPLTTIAILIIFVNFQEFSISTDGLTGLNNRRRFEIRAEMLFKDDDSHPVTLLLMDVDRFKSINDTYGHRTGDAALVEVSSILKRNVGDHRLLISRYGGDEFAILGRFDSDDGAEKLKARIAEVFEERNRGTKAPYRLVLSIGIGRSDEHITTVDALVTSADKKLYEEKRAHYGKSPAR